MFKLNVNEYAPFYKSYIDILDGESDILKNLNTSYAEAKELLTALPIEKQEYRYTKGKWTIKEMLQHLIDTERIFAFRALHIARQDDNELPGFDENNYITNSNGNARAYQDLLDELETVRKTTVFLFKSFTNEALVRTGVINKDIVSVRAIGYLISGHQLHHMKVIKERYI